MSITSEEFERRLESWKKLYDMKVLTEEEFSDGAKKLGAMLITAPEDRRPNGEDRPDVLQKNDEYLVNPWKRRRDYVWRIQDEYEKEMGSEEEEDNFFRDLFINKARNGLLTPMDSLVGQYLVFAKNSRSAKRMLLSMLLKVKHENRVEFHNWYVARTWNDLTLHTVGDTIQTLPVPLFPKEMEELNEKIMNVHSLYEGGSRPRDATPEERLSRYTSIFRTIKKDTLDGGDYIVPVRTLDGSQVVGATDLTEIETGFGHLNRRLGAVEIRLQEMSGPQATAGLLNSRPSSAQRRRSSSSRGASPRFTSSAKPAWRGGGDNEGDHDTYDAAQDAKNSSGLHRA